MNPVQFKQEDAEKPSVADQKPTASKGAAAAPPAPTTVSSDQGLAIEYVTSKNTPVPFEFALDSNDHKDVIMQYVREKGNWLDCPLIVDSFTKYGATFFPEIAQWHQQATVPRLTVLDIGANIGSCTLNLASLGYNVLAFEPAQRNAALLHAAVRRNTNITGQIGLFEVALSGTQQISTIYREVGNSGNGIVAKDADSPPAEAKNWKQGYEKESIRTIKLDDLSGTIGRADFMKMDVQGHEVAALRGARKFFTGDDAARRPPRVIVLELSPALIEDAGDNPIELFQILDEYGYKIYLQNGKLLSKQEFQTFVSFMHSSSHEDLVAVVSQ